MDFSWRTISLLHQWIRVSQASIFQTFTSCGAPNNKSVNVRFIRGSFRPLSLSLTGVNFIKALAPKFVPQSAKKDSILTFEFHNTYWAVTPPKMGNKIAQNALPKKWLFLAKIIHAKLPKVFNTITICLYETHLALTLKVGIMLLFFGNTLFMRFHAGVKVFMKWTPGNTWGTVA